MSPSISENKNIEEKRMSEYKESRSLSTIYCGLSKQETSLGHVEVL